MANTILMGAFAALAVLFGVIGLAQRGTRSKLWPGALAAAGAALAARGDSFWTMILLGLLSLWCAWLAVPWGDISWRARFGFVKAVAVIAALSLWPSVSNMTSGKLPCPEWVQERVGARLVAGLDLRGGMRLVYTVDVAEAVKDKRDAYYESMRRELTKLYLNHEGDEAPTEEELAKLREIVDLKKSRSQSNLLRLTLLPGADPGKIDARFRDLFKPDLEAKKVSDTVFEFSLRQAAESAIRERAVAQAKDIILRRVDSMGLREAAVSTRDEDIIVEVPGEDEGSFNQIREIISKTARLEFKLVDDESPFFAELSRSAAPDSLPEGLSFEQQQVNIGLDADGDILTTAVTYAVLPGLKDEMSSETLERFRAWVATLDIPQDREVGFMRDYSVDPATGQSTEIGFRTILLKSRTEITGDMVRDAAARPDQGQGSFGGWNVSLTFTDQGGKIFERITGANIQRRFAIILDGRVESAPNILDRIAGGQASISMGAGDPQAQLRDARKLELVLRSGALPAPISPSNEQLIGPSLGQESIRLGVEGAAAGGLVVLAFMILYYRRAGLIADIAVLMNLFLQMAILASFGASMTLPGIAGLALTLGMSVDANVLINERIREELRDGKSPRAAVELGYSKALSAIIDGQLTTLISGIVLAQYGTGPIKGFAITLMVGVICSIFTGVVVSRVLFDLWVRSMGKKSSFSLG
ncbi:MAG: protein translocase subunit SecD [Polyangiaceae bacterium]|nr:protein translocase subunit SecD [Polyangiaceae bacterium]